ncbi:hypothetical protein [Nocardioides jishulii]|uniref:hypothetical protein n=1 Tax=Nocardioides jishulii TaxID=2575440 RepID=UPI001484DB4F|nr:hypothetical protein [Nocardioides jishulii]
MRSSTSLTRRGVLAAGGALTLAAATSACDLLPVPSSDETDSPRVDPDLRRVETVTAQVRELVALTVSVGLAHPSPAVAALEECHRAHLAVLSPSDEVEATPSPATSPTASPTVSADVSVKSLAALERTHVTTLTAEAGVAESGALARLLASMAAGVGMHLPALVEGDDA